MEAIYDEVMWRGEMTSELRHITQRLGDVQRQLCELQSSLAQELAAHRKYHEENEHKWGAIKWCSLHPFRFAMIAGCATAFFYGEELLPMLRVLVGVF